MDEFEAMTRDCAPVVDRFLFSLCGNRDLAEELTSETFYRAWLHIDRFRGECRPETWLCRIDRKSVV